MSDTARTARTPARRGQLQFTLGTLLLGMFVFAVFFGSSGLWYRQAAAQRASLSGEIAELRGVLEAERRAHRETRARLLVAETQLKDAVGVRLGQQQSERESAERRQEELSVFAQRLQRENARARQQIENLRRQLQLTERSTRTGEGRPMPLP